METRPPEKGLGPGGLAMWGVGEPQSHRWVGTSPPPLLGESPQEVTGGDSRGGAGSLIPDHVSVRGAKLWGCHRREGGLEVPGGEAVVRAVACVWTTTAYDLISILKGIHFKTANKT